MDNVSRNETSEPQPLKRPLTLNNFSLVIATINGTGSQTANLAILHALFKMGIPVNGKNIFPSNIQGLPTWYHIRLSKDGYVTLQNTPELLVAFNQDTLHKDIQKLPPGGVCLHNGDWHNIPQRHDITYYAIPVHSFVRASGVNGKLRTYITNMVYVGAVAQLIGISIERLDEALEHHFKERSAQVEKNLSVIRAAYEWTAVNLTKTDPYYVEPMNATEGQIMITGNEAAALGAVYGGVTFSAWYPITPSTSIIDSLSNYLKILRHDQETKKATYAVVQAEDELAAIGMILGAGWAGARAMTATSGPGISLMSEFAGLGYFVEIPAVIWNVQRVGPSTGLPTRTGQCDLLSTYYLGHGDTEHVVLLPGTVKECFEFGPISFNLADELQTPVFVLSDLDLGMNNWVSEPFVYPIEPIKRGKVLSADGVMEGYGRYEDIDEDGICNRTLPGNKNQLGAWFARGTGHNEQAGYSECTEDWRKNTGRLKRKFDTARKLVPSPIIDNVYEASVGIIAFGSTKFAIDEARDRLAAEGFNTSFLRLLALPINDDVKAFVARHDKVYVIELNRDGQLHKILQTEMPELAAKLASLAILDGMPLTAHWVIEAVNGMQ